ncbi:hypothetical protein BC833DRAFT_592087 [Globomyces pollinis-pini]|nr:hypothetical protein BC833DRAFT_592087 [Globomyces pollinis-pini]
MRVFFIISLVRCLVVLILARNYLHLTSAVDPVSLRTKVVAFIKLEKYNDALDEITQSSFSDSIHLLFEKAYCLYRLNRLSEALDVVDTIYSNHNIENSPLNIHLSQLKAQLYYRQESFVNALDIYSNNLENVETNSIACEVANILCSVNSDHQITLNTESYDTLFNVACVSIAKEDFANALKLLNSSIELCKSSMTEEGYDEGSIESELAFIIAQKGIVLQTIGDIEGCITAYGLVKSFESTNQSVISIIDYNLALLNGNSKKLAGLSNVLLSDSNNSKLNSYQSNLIRLNNLLLSNDSAKTSKLAEKLAALGDIGILQSRAIHLEAGLNLKSKKESQILSEIQKLSLTYPDSIVIQLLLVQTHLQKGNWNAAESILIKVLSNPSNESYKSGLISLLAWIYEKTNTPALALKILESQDSTSKTDLFHLATLKLKMGQTHNAAEDFENLVQHDPSDLKAIAGYILSIADSDPKKAEEYLEHLTSDIVRAPCADVDLETFGKANQQQDKDALKKVLPKRKRRKVKKLPKDYDPQRIPDPQRWLPKTQRKEFQNDKKATGFGYQGVALEGGGMGSTGSARIAGVTRAAVDAPAKHAEAASIITPGPTPVVSGKPVPINANVPKAALKKRRKGKK